MSQSKVNTRLLPDVGSVNGGLENLNVQSIQSADQAALVSAIRELCGMLQTGSAAPSGTAPSTGAIYIRTLGTSVTNLYVAPANSATWYPIQSIGDY
jgi:hypothetical protein